MRSIILALFIVLPSTALAFPRGYHIPRAPKVKSYGPVQHRGYINKRGTYVAPHVQSAPNRTKLDNWSSKPNVNPYTGKAGAKDPWKPGG